MPLSRASLERQLKTARTSYQARCQVLSSRGVEGAACSKDPAWRRLRSTCLGLEARLRTVTVVEKLDEELKQRKAAAAAEPEAAVAAPKKSKAKSADKPAKDAPKGGGSDKPAKDKGAKDKGAKDKGGKDKGGKEKKK